MINLSNGNEWIQIYDQFHTAQVDPNVYNGHYPLKAIRIPTIIDNSIVAILSSTIGAKPKWTLGGSIYPVIDVSPQSSIGHVSTIYSHKFPLNEATAVHFREISGYYRVAVNVPAWFKNVYLQAWVFTGQVLSNSIEQKLDNVVTRLTAIENALINSQP